MFKKRWFDGLQDIYEGKDEFEIKFGCFGGDGGPSGGNTGKAQGEHDTTPNTGFRGEQSANSPSNQGFSGPTGVGIGPGTSGTTSGSTSGSTSGTEGGQLGFGHLSTEAPPSEAPPSSKATEVGLPGQNLSNTLSSNLPSLSDMMALAPTMGVPTTTPSGLVADQKAEDTSLGIDAFGGRITGSLGKDSIGIGYSTSFAKGGVVHQGIGSVFPYRRR